MTTAGIQTQIGGATSDRIAEVGASLNTSIRAVLGFGPTAVVTGQEIQRISGMNRVFSQRLATALRPVDPMATVWHIPGPEPLRRMLGKMREADVPQEVLRDAVSATEEFSELIRTVAGDRSGLDAIVSSALPESRAKVENEAKQLVYRGMRQIKGMAAEVVLDCMILSPSVGSDRIDLLTLKGYYGLRCVRPGARMKLGQSGADAPGAVGCSIRGESIGDWQKEVLLRPFCSDPEIEITVDHVDTNYVYSMQWGGEVGTASARDIVLGDMRKNGPRRWRSSDNEKPRTGITYEINVPSKRYVNDMLLHEDVYPDWEMGVRILETGERGSASANDKTRDLDVLDLRESIEFLGKGTERCRSTDIPNYIELLRHVFGEAGWDASKFRGYRMKMDYPVFGSQVQYRFDLPMKPGM